MENIINFYYNLFPDKVQKMYGGFYFEINDLKFIIIELFQPSKSILEIYDKLMLNHINNYIIISNKDNSPVTTIEEKEYILFQINCDHQKILLFYEQLYIPAENVINWSKLWSERINYYEIQINELAQDKKIVLQSIYYYIGLAENAIYIAGKNEQESNNEMLIQHYRMNVPIRWGDYFNPANMVIDVYIRDIAEYIKSSYFCENKDDNFYIEYINSFNYNEKTANLLLARLLYPCYYFDIFDEIILNDRDEEELIPVITQSKNYEKLLVKIYNELQKKYPIININWIRKKSIIQH